MRKPTHLITLIALIATVTAFMLASAQGYAQTEPTATPAQLDMLAIQFESLQQQAANNAMPTTPGKYALTLEHDGLTREYLLMIPISYTPDQPAPLTFIFHGSSQFADTFADRRIGLQRQANERGMILVFPQSTFVELTDAYAWVARDDLPLEADEIPDDVDFILALLDLIQASLNVDAARIYAAGFSNGGNFAQYLAGNAPPTFAALAAIASSLPVNEVDGTITPMTAPANPVSIMVVNGLRDTTRPYEGGTGNAGQYLASVAEGVAFWVEHNACDPMPNTESRRQNVVVVDRYNCPQDVHVLLVTLARMDHRWPDADAGFGFDANVTLLEFFELHTLPE